MSSLSRILSPVTVFDMPASLVMKIAGESKESQTIREQLNKELLILTKGSATCKRFVRTKADGISVLPLNLISFKKLIVFAEGSSDPLLADDYLTRESRNGSICEEVKSDTEESELSDTSNEQLDPPEALDGPVDEAAPPYPEKEFNPSAKPLKKASKKKNKKLHA